jgi:hypothetical protein
MKKKTAEIKDVVVRETPAMLLSVAMKAGVDLDKISKAMELQERYEMLQAKKAYSVAMANFKADPPEIEKDKRVKFSTTSGVTQYDHASLANVTGKINSALSKHGLSATWKTKQAEKDVTVTCIISHALGHSEETSLTAGIDMTGNKNPIQALGSTISYLERYTILALTGLATHDMDNDAQSVAYIIDNQLSTIVDMITAKEVDQKKFLDYMNCESLEKIPAADFNKAVAALRAAKGKVK